MQWGSALASASEAGRATPAGGQVFGPVRWTAARGIVMRAERALSYEELFGQRGSAYDRAMLAFPQARAQEFAQAIAAARPEAGMVVADVPAGGGYLRRYLPRGCDWIGHEPCADFTNHRTGQSDAGTPLLPLPFADRAADVAISLAGVHHLDDKRPLFREIRRIIRPGGRFVLSDVAAGTPTARFLDGFVGDTNSTGHEGIFLDAHTLEELAAAGWEVVSHRLEHFHWVFADNAAMVAFCRGLFDIRKADDAAVLRALLEGPGVDALAGGGVGLRWSLMTIVAQRPDA